MIKSINKEIELRNKYLNTSELKSIYFGGGTPSILHNEELTSIFNAIQNTYIISDETEISIECNPDDLNTEKLMLLYKLGINRLSIGVQSFKNEDLIFMNRSHNSQQALNCIKKAKDIGFTNISIDLIFSLPDQTLEDWAKNLKIALGLGIQHISCYSLTIEKKTKLAKLIETGEISELDDISSSKQFKLLIKECEKRGFIHYEISNFAKKGYFSQHNLCYWTSKKYLGIGPSSHSYNGVSRECNISNNTEYINSLSKNKIPSEIEHLNNDQRYNEYLFTSLRTILGADMSFVKENFGNKYFNVMYKKVEKWISSNHLIKKNNQIYLTDKGKFIANSICSDFFII